MTHKPMTQDEVLAVLDRQIATYPHKCGARDALVLARDTIAIMPRAWNVSPSADVVGGAVRVTPTGGVEVDGIKALKYALRRRWRRDLAQQGGESKE